MNLPVTLMTPLIALALSTTSLAAGTSSLESRLKSQADAWDQAIIHKDGPAVSANIAETFMQIGGDGAASNKQAFVDALMDEKLRIDPYEVEDFRIRVYGDTAILTGSTAMHGSYAGKPFSIHYRYADVYVKQGENWRVVNVQTTPIK